MKDIDIVWFVEHKARELDVACAVRFLIERRYGRSVQILYYDGNRAPLTAREYRPKVVVIPYCYSAADTHLIAHLKVWPDAIYFNLAWEELYYNAYMSFKAPRGTLAVKHVIHQAWSDFYRDYLLRHGVPERHVFVNGQPAYKLYDEPYRRHFMDRSKMANILGLDMDLPWVFFPENYGWAFFPESQLRDIIARGLEREAVYQMRDYCRSSLEIVLGWVEEAASDGSVEFVFRPRPATNQSDYEALIDRVIQHRPQRLHISKTGSVREWIMAADVVLSSYSTSLIEAAVARRPAYMVEPSPVPPPLDAYWYVHLTRLTTSEEFLAACLQPPDNSSSESLRTWARRDLMGRGDAISNLADFVAGLAGPGAERPTVPSQAALNEFSRPLSYGRTSVLRSFARRLRHALGSGSGPTRNEHVPEFDDIEIAKRVNSFASLLGETV